MREPRTPAPRRDGPPPIALFFSFKGGVGRTQALTALALLMRQHGERVLVIDGDIEAPGLTLSPPFRSSTHEKPGLVELFLEIRRAAVGTSVGRAPGRKRRVRLEPYVHQVDVPAAGLTGGILEPIEEGGQVDIIPAGVVDAGYGARLDELSDAPGVLDGANGAVFFDALRALLLRTDYALVLVDVRTGLSQMAGMMIQRVADLVVVFAGLNDQNIEGTARVMSGVQPVARADGPVVTGNRVLLVASPVPEGEERLKHERLQLLEERLGMAPDVILHYCPLVALSEDAFFTLASSDTRLVGEHRQLLNRVRERIGRSLDHLVGGWVRELEGGNKDGARREARAAALWYPKALREQLGLISIRYTLGSDAPTDSGLYRTLGHALQDLRRPDAALTWQVVSHILWDSSSPDWLALAADLLGLMRHNQPKNMRLLAWHGHVRARLGASRCDVPMLRAGLESIQDAKRDFPDEADYERFQAQAEADLGAFEQSYQTDAAVRRMRAAAARSPDDPDTLVTLGYSLFRDGQRGRNAKTLEQALDALKRSLTLALGPATSRLARHAAAETALILGDIERNEKRAHEALTYVKVVSPRDENDPDILLSYGRARSRVAGSREDVHEATAAFRRADKLRPDHAVTLDAWSHALRRTWSLAQGEGDLERAYQLAARAHALDPVCGLMNMAWARALQGRNRDAAPFLARALKAGVVSPKEVRGDAIWRVLLAKPQFRKLVSTKTVRMQVLASRKGTRRPAAK